MGLKTSAAESDVADNGDVSEAVDEVLHVRGYTPLLFLPRFYEVLNDDVTETYIGVEGVDTFVHVMPEEADVKMWEANEE